MFFFFFYSFLCTKWKSFRNEVYRGQLERVCSDGVPARRVLFPRVVVVV